MPMDGMMAGVMPPAPGAEPAKKPLPVTPLGRYLKILLEFVGVRIHRLTKLVSSAKLEAGS